MTALVALLALVATNLATLAVGRELLRRRDREAERQAHNYERERAQLLDRIMYMARMPWSPPAFEEPAEPYSEQEFMYPESELIT